MGLRQLKTPTTSRENTQQWWWVQYVYPASASSPQTKTNQCLQTWSIKACPHLGEWSVHGGRWELEAIHSGFQRKPCLWSGGLGQCGQSVSSIVASRPCLGHGDYACLLGNMGTIVTLLLGTGGYGRCHYTENSTPKLNESHSLHYKVTAAP